MARTTLALLSLLAASGAAMADDLTPPPWRFQPQTTVQHWDFSAGPGGGAPDALPLNNIYGTPNFVPTTGTNWLTTFNGRNNVWALGGGGSLNFDIPNDGDPNDTKFLWLQITYFSLAPTPPPGVVIGSSSGLFTQIGGPFNTALPGGWVHQLTQWQITPCPLFERVTIFPGLVGAQSFIDQVVVDTQCVPTPTPGTASLAAVGGLLAFRRRRAPAN